MQIYQTRNYYEMSVKAASIISSQMILKPNSVLGLATGSTPEGLYQQLIAKNLRGEINFANIHTVNLDEYVGLNSDNDQSYSYYMHEKLFDHINILEENCHLLDGMAKDSETECNRYDKLIKDLGGIDIQLLGVGPNGHIGFNEPNTHFSKGTNLVGLTQSTIDANSRFFDNLADVPRHAYTIGIKSIMSAKKILFIVNGKHKAEILRQIVYGKITPEVPASVLQLHNDVTLVADSEAMSLL